MTSKLSNRFHARSLFSYPFLYQDADFLICLSILDIATKVANIRISEDSRVDMLNTYLSPSPSGHHFASILVGMQSMKV